MIRTAAVVILSMSLLGLPAYAAETNKETATAAPTEAGRPNVSALGADVGWSLPPVEFGAAKRPAALPALYVSFAALQAFDGYSTIEALSRGASEANPMMKGAASSPATFWAVKAATAVSAMMVAERLWKTNKPAAIAMMVIANGVAAAVAANNASVLKQLR